MADWNSEHDLFPWTSLFISKLREHSLPQFLGETIYAASDCSGRTRESRIDALSFLLTDYDYCGEWHLEREEVRKRYLADMRRMSFKDLNDGMRRRALVPFLKAADLIPGLCLTIVIDKRMKKLCSDEELFTRVKPTLRGKWNPRSFEYMARLAYFLSVLFAGLSLPNQNLYWIGDTDDFLATQERATDTAELLSRFSSLLISHPLGQLGVGSTSLDEGDRLEEDLAAVPDLVAGALTESVNGMFRHYGKIPSVITMAPETSRKTDLISSWFFSRHRTRLTKIAIVFEYVSDNHSRIGSFRIEPSDETEISKIAKL